ncbi:MAG: tetratricopeptide repeat protein [bacterium]
MSRHLTSLVITAILIFSISTSHSQDFRSKWGFGLNAGGQKLYGDQRGGISAGIEGFASYNVAKFADVSLSIGYSQLKYFPTGFSRFTNLINADLKGNFDLVSNTLVRPFLTFGLGIISFKHPSNNRGRFFDGAIIGGVGLRFKVHRLFDVQVSGDYRFITGDQLDDPTLAAKQGVNDGYLNVRAGVSYYLPKKGAETPQVIAMEKAPFYELGEESQYGEEKKQDYGSQETKDMEEYVKLKSRLDKLSNRIDSEENQISKLRGSLQEKKQKVSSLSKTVARQPSRPVTTKSSRAGFADTYEEALTNFYNKHYNEAISLFGFLLQQYPNHSLASSCQYWIGESNFAMAQYDSAIDAFFKVLSYNRSPKKDDSLFLLGKTYLKTGSGERAKESFNRLIREYPDSEYVFDAKDYLSKL